MKKQLYIIISLLITEQCMAQVPEEALRLSWTTQQGTARSMATGGAMVSLGGDATAVIVNPAGLAFFKTSDFVISPGLQFGKAQSAFRGTPYTDANKNRLAVGTSGFVFGGYGYKAKNSFAVTYTRLADFNQRIYYKGQNDYSSFAEPLADEFAASHLTIDQALNSPDISLTTRMALYTYLVDTATINGNMQVIARSEFPGLLNQEYTSESSGGLNEVSFGIGHELEKKFLVGGTVGVVFTNLERNTYYRESDATGNTSNYFNFFAYDERYKLSGFGVNFRVGAIYRPKEFIRLGIALHSPNILMLKEKFNSGLATDVENLFTPGYDSVSSATINGAPVPDAKYTLYTPGRIMISGSYVFREVENVNRQKGFITADIEWVNYKWNRFGSSEEETSDTKAFYKPYNDAIDAIYRSTFNFRIGGELKFKIVMARLGFAYYGNPYKDKELKARKMNLSGGLGYRNKGVFVDLTYVHRLNKDVHFPYRVNYPRANTFATLKDNGGSVYLTVGCKI